MKILRQLLFIILTCYGLYALYWVGISHPSHIVAITIYGYWCFRSYKWIELDTRRDKV